ncbi:LysR family transcriptional regulator [Streptomyces sp. NPDC014802]|uniref:LysR family transcriptional regulator n=1 Tax=Streptomyces sp. NPDC014802 TaxID=3364917 RepID=UPI0036FEA395
MDLLAHLEAYVAAVEEESFSRAADRLGIAQPLLSRRIKTLEEHFGGRLFDRSRRQVTTTGLGLHLLPYAQDVLEGAQRLRRAARASRRSAVRRLGVPADCDPAALARVLRAGAEHGTPLAVHELPPEARTAGLADGSLEYALLRTPPEGAALRVPLGLATTPEADGVPYPGRPKECPVHRDEPPACPDESPARLDEPPVHAKARPFHLEDLRPRRGRGAPRPAPPLLVLTEDQAPEPLDRLERAVARAGLPETLVRPAASTAAALAEALAGTALLLCAAPFARRHGAAWAPLADTSLHRGYDLRAARRSRRPGHVADWLAAALAAAVGAAPTAPAQAGEAGEDARIRLAARG